ncbi:MAG: hypothetical protein AAF791_12860 [Bacteroidota bacterium]
MALRLLAVSLLFVPLAASAQSPFGDNCHLTIERAVNQVPFDNAVKYGTLLILAAFPETSPAAIALGREEVAADVRVAALRGAADCLRDPAKREEALRLIAIAKATDDWAGFASNLRNATGLGPEQMLGSEVLANLSITDAVMADLGDGAFAVRDGYDALGGQRQISFQTALRIHADLASQFASNCQWTASDRLFEATETMIRERRPNAIIEMIQASRVLRGRPLTSEPDLMAFDPTPYLSTNAKAVSDFLRARGDYRLSDQVLTELETLAGQTTRTRPRMESALRRVNNHIGDARLALEQCNLPRMRSAMQLVSREPEVLTNTPMNRSLSLLAGALSGETEVFSDAELRVSLAGSNGCWGTPVTAYNSLVTDYYRLRDINIPGRDEDRIASTLARGRRALGMCDEAGARNALAAARDLLPASLDPGNLCLNAAWAEDEVAVFEQEIGPAIATCTSSTAPRPTPASSQLVCPTAPRGWALRPSREFGGPERPPGEISVEDDALSGEREGTATCAYTSTIPQNGGLALRVKWLERPRSRGQHGLCDGEPGRPLVTSTGTWSLAHGAYSTEELVGPYTDTMSLGISFSLVYSSRQRAAWVYMTEFHKEAFDDSGSEWRLGAATHLLREVSPYAWQCPDR